MELGLGVRLSFVACFFGSVRAGVGAGAWARAYTYSRNKTSTIAEVPVEKPGSSDHFGARFSAICLVKISWGCVCVWGGGGVKGVFLYFDVSFSSAGLVGLTRQLGVAFFPKAVCLQNVLCFGGVVSREGPYSKHDRWVICVVGGRSHPIRCRNLRDEQEQGRQHAQRKLGAAVALTRHHRNARHRGKYEEDKGEIEKSGRHLELRAHLRCGNRRVHGLPLVREDVRHVDAQVGARAASAEFEQV